MTHSFFKTAWLAGYKVGLSFSSSISRAFSFCSLIRLAVWHTCHVSMPQAIFALAGLSFSSTIPEQNERPLIVYCLTDLFYFVVYMYIWDFSFISLSWVKISPKPNPLLEVDCINFLLLASHPAPHSPLKLNTVIHYSGAAMPHNTHFTVYMYYPLADRYKLIVKQVSGTQKHPRNWQETRAPKKLTRDQ